MFLYVFIKNICFYKKKYMWPFWYVHVFQKGHFLYTLCRTEFLSNRPQILVTGSINHEEANKKGFRTIRTLCASRMRDARARLFAKRIKGL